jgi:hypothetical protein
MATPTEQKKSPAAAPAVAPAANGPKPTAVAPVPAPASNDDAAKAASDAEAEEKTRGAIPNMPVCIIWQDPKTKRVTASLVHPKGGDFRIEARGIGGATGELMDMGYPIGAVRVDGPKWAEKRVPAGVTVLGFANVQGFPLPEQTP